ncbi:uncharacterized protein JCM6883_006528 [Sporobolomyces salmoneus]|uniref:uncharacterized protein n=1 Tax=Sporobolomyces salmoneus TaxID=183962 RepID=UPI00317B3D99
MRYYILSLLTLAVVALGINSTPPTPELEHLFTVNLDCESSTAPLLPGPLGTRINVGIVGGNYTDRDGVTDSRIGLAFIDARWVIELPAQPSTNGLNGFVYVKSTGYSAPTYEDGTFFGYLRLKLETGVPEYYWMNHAMVIATLEVKNIDNLFDPTNKEIQNAKITTYDLKSGWKPTDKVFTCLSDPVEGCPNFVAGIEEIIVRDEL